MKKHFFPLTWCVLSLSALLNTGCTSAGVNPGQPQAALTGNWSFTAPVAQGAQALTLNAGFTQVSTGTVYAVAHLNGAACVSAGTGIVLNGTIDRSNQVSMASQPFGGTTLSLHGQLSADGKTLSNAAWSFKGGSCAALGSSTVNATEYAEIDGTYTGTFVDADNNQLPVTVVLTQTGQPDTNGQFHLSGSATFPNNPCFTQSIVTDSLVTGSNLSTTYTQGSASIIAVGTFNSSATQLMVTNWQVSGGLCDGDSGTGLLTEQ